MWLHFSGTPSNFSRLQTHLRILCNPLRDSNDAAPYLPLITEKDLPFSHLTSPSVTDSAKAGVLIVTTSSPVRTQKEKNQF